MSKTMFGLHKVRFGSVWNGLTEGPYARWQATESLPLLAQIGAKERLLKEWGLPGIWSRGKAGADSQSKRIRKSRRRKGATR